MVLKYELNVIHISEKANLSLISAISHSTQGDTF